ncbi:MAG TPA: hypothetical protein VJ546_04505, partial [Bacillales bacterium]|nr:hypothetical protein [Bacillales bacterium]
FGAFLQKIPGCFVFLGNGDDSEGIGNVPLHNSSYDYNSPSNGIVSPILGVIIFTPDFSDDFNARSIGSVLHDKQG